jgi:hypothetical protein
MLNEIRTVEFSRESSFVHACDLTVASVTLDDDSLVMAARHPEGWLVFFFCAGDTLMPSFSHGSDCLGIVRPNVFADSRVGPVLDILADGVDLDMTSESEPFCSGAVGRAALTVEGQLNMFEESL